MRLDGICSGRVNALDPREALLDLVADLKHDLAKYVAWRTANYGDEAWSGSLQPEFVEALQADVLRTYRDRPAWVLWDERRESLRALGGGQALAAVECAIETLRGHESALRAGRSASLARALPSIREAQHTIRASISAFHKALRDG